jgi:hypothetical protein
VPPLCTNANLHSSQVGGISQWCHTFLIINVIIFMAVAECLKRSAGRSCARALLFFTEESSASAQPSGSQRVFEVLVAEVHSSDPGSLSS